MLVTNINDNNRRIRKKNIIITILLLFLSVLTAIYVQQQQLLSSEKIYTPIIRLNDGTQIRGIIISQPTSSLPLSLPQSRSLSSQSILTIFSGFIIRMIIRIIMMIMINDHHEDHEHQQFLSSPESIIYFFQGIRYGKLNYSMNLS